MPKGNVYTDNMYTRVMPAQGCYDVGKRSYDANGYAYDNQADLTRPSTTPGQGNPSPDCTLPAFAGNPCALGVVNPVGAATCLAALAGGICVLEGLPSAVCNLLTGGVIAQSATPASITHTSLTTQPQRGVLGLPTQQLPGNTQATQDLVSYLLK